MLILTTTTTVLCSQLQEKYATHLENLEPSKTEIENKIREIDYWVKSKISLDEETCDDEILILYKHSFFNYYLTLKILSDRKKNSKDVFTDHFVTSIGDGILSKLPTGDIFNLALCSTKIYKSISERIILNVEYDRKYVVYNKQEYEINVKYVNALMNKYDNKKNLL